MTDCSLRLTDVPSLLTKGTEDGFVSQLKALWQSKTILTGTFSKFTGNEGVHKLSPTPFPHLQGGLKTVGGTLQCSGEQRNPSPRGLCVYSEVKSGESPTETPRAAQSSHSPQFLSHLQALQRRLHIWKRSAQAPASSSQTSL